MLIHTRNGETFISLSAGCGGGGRLKLRDIKPHRLASSPPRRPAPQRLAATPHKPRPKPMLNAAAIYGARTPEAAMKAKAEAHARGMKALDPATIYDSRKAI